MSYIREEDTYYSSDASYTSISRDETSDDDNSPSKKELKEVIEKQRKELKIRTEMLVKARAAISTLQRQSTDRIPNISRISSITLGDGETDDIKKLVERQKLVDENEKLKTRMELLEKTMKDKEEELKNETKREMLEKMSTLQKKYIEVDEQRVIYIRQINQLEQKLRDSETESNQLRVTLSKLQDKIEKVQTENQILENKYQVLEKEKEEAYEELKSVKNASNNNKLDQKIHDNEKEISEHKDTIKKLQHKEAKQKKKLEDTTSNNIKLEQKIRDDETEINNLKETVKKLQNKVEKLRKNTKEITETHANNLREQKFVTEQKLSKLDEITSANAQLEQKLRNNEIEFHQQKETIRRLQEKIDKINMEKQNIDDRLCDMTKEKETLLKEINSLRNAKEMSEREQYQLREQKTIAEMKNSRLEESIINLKSSQKDPEIEERKKKDDTLDFAFAMAEVPTGNYDKLKQKLMDKVVQLQQLNDQVKNTQRDAAIVIDLKNILHVKRAKDIAQECSRIVNLLNRYVEQFPKLQNMIDEVRKTLNTSNLDDIVPTIKRLMILTKGVDQWIQDSTKVNQRKKHNGTKTKIMDTQFLLDDVVGSRTNQLFSM